MTLDKYKLPLKPVPEVVELALSHGVQESEFPKVTSANEILDNWEDLKNKVFRSKSGKVLVTCETLMPEVSADMIDWWFGWHLPYSERYQLWHLDAHQKAKVKDNRSKLTNSRAQYIGNTSFVNEYIGKNLHRLAISFFEPQQIGFVDAYSHGSTAICGVTANRLLNTDAGYLVHYIHPTVDGCIMKSMFWLGEFKPRMPLVSNLVSRISNTLFFRKKIVSDQMAVDLLRHCSEEMNHLVKFLPTLYRDMQKEHG